MRQATGNIWDWLGEHAEVVIPTNQGWRTDGTNVMGAGLARQAADRYRGIEQWYGAWCREHRDESCVVRYPAAPLIFFPTKPLNPEAPHLSWKSPATLETIQRSLRDLERWPGEGLVALPLVGCGLGGLSESVVVPLLEAALTADRFVLVRDR